MNGLTRDEAIAKVEEYKYLIGTSFNNSDIKLTIVNLIITPYDADGTSKALEEYHTGMSKTFARFFYPEFHLYQILVMTGGMSYGLDGHILLNNYLQRNP